MRMESIPAKKEEKKNLSNPKNTALLIFLSIICVGLLFMSRVYKDNVTLKKYIYGSLFLIVIYSFIYFFYGNKKTKKIKKISTTELWNNEIVKMNTPFLHTNPPTAIQGPVGVSYTMNMKITDWMYDKNVEYREIFTHGKGSFGNLQDNDVLSVAIKGHKNDIRIDINTIQYIEDTTSGSSCSSYTTSQSGMQVETSDNKPTIIGTESIVLEYFPINKYFHLAIVLSNNRVDTYIDGKLHITKVLKGNVNLPRSVDESAGTDENSLPSSDDLIFFQGHPIKGEMHDFIYFKTELSLKLIQDIYAISKTSDIDYYSEQLPEDHTKFDFIESQCN